MTTPQWARQDEQIELIAWKGSLSALVARMQLEAGEVKRLRAICRTAKPGFLVLDIHLHNPAPLLAALRRRLTPAPDVASGGTDGALPAHLMGQY